MADLKDLADKRTARLWIDPRRLKIKPGLNACDLSTPDNVAHIEWLAGSIAEEGLKKDLEISREGDEVFVADGHCRLAAIHLAISRGVDIKLVPCVPEPKGVNDAHRILNQNLANSGKPLTPLEEGYNIKRAISLGMSVAEVAKTLNRSTSYVNHAVEFQAAPAMIHNAVKAGEISATLAAEVTRRDGPLFATETIRKAVDVARTKGKKRATAKDIARDAAEDSHFNAAKFKVANVPIKIVGGAHVSVKLGRDAYILPIGDWQTLAERILDVIEKKAEAA